MIKKLLYMISHDKPAFGLAVLWGVTNAIFASALNPLILKYLFDEGIIKGNFRLFLILAFGAMVVFTVWRLSNLAYSLYAQRLKNRIMGNLAQRMLQHYHRIPYGEVIKRGDGYFVSRIYDEVYRASQPVTDTVLRILNSGATITTGLIVILSLSWKLTLILAVIAPGLYLLSRRFAARIQTRSKEEQEEEAQLRNVTTQIVHSYKSTNIFQLHSLVFRLFRDQLDRFIHVFYQRLKSSWVYTTLSNIFTSWMEMSVIIGAGYMILVKEMTFGGFMAFMNAFWIVIGALRELTETVPQMGQLMASIERLMEFEALATASASPSPFRQVGRLSLKRVEFSYGGTPIIRGLTLSSTDGDRILIVGPNGSGKTTLAAIMTGLLTPQQGEVSVPSTVSALIEPVAFPPASLRELIPPGKEAEAYDLAARFDLLDHLDKQFDELSTGQRKKFGVLLALLKEADCYVFDEPLASVDVGSKEIIMEAIFEKTKGKTLVVIMHGEEKFHGQFSRILNLCSPLLGKSE